MNTPTLHLCAPHTSAPTKPASAPVARFLEFMRSERHASALTVKSYRSDLHQFGQFLSRTIGHGSHPTTRPIASLDEQFLLCDSFTACQFINYLRAQKYKSASVARKLSTVKTLYSFLHRRGMIAVNPVLLLRVPKPARPFPKFLDTVQLDELLEAPGHGSVLAARDSAILALLCYSGIRVSELVALRAADLDLQTCVVRIPGFSPRGRSVPLADHAVTALKRYWHMRSGNDYSRLEMADRFFLNKYGGPLSSRSVRRNLNKYMGHAGLSLQNCPTTLRDSVIVAMLNAGASPRAIQKLLGHQTTSSAMALRRHLSGARTAIPITAPAKISTPHLTAA